MKKKVFRVLTVLVAVVLVMGVAWLSNPLRWPHEMIRARMLKTTPIGTSMDEVSRIVEENGWSIRGTRDCGYLLSNGSPSLILEEDEHEYTRPIIGEKSMLVHIGEYRIFFAVDVEVYFAFDENSNLIDIAISKEADVM